MNSSIAPISTIIMFSFLWGFANAQERTPIANDEKTSGAIADSGQDVLKNSENRLQLNTGENLWNGLSLEPNEATPNSISKLSVPTDLRPPLAIKQVYWKSDNVKYENPVFDEPMLGRYGIADSYRPELREIPRFYLKSLALPLVVLTGRDRSCVSPPEPNCTPTRLKK